MGAAVWAEPFKFYAIYSSGVHNHQDYGCGDPFRSQENKTMNKQRAKIQYRGPQMNGLLATDICI